MKMLRVKSISMKLRHKIRADARRRMASMVAKEIEDASLLGEATDPDTIRRRIAEKLAR